MFVFGGVIIRALLKYTPSNRYLPSFSIQNISFFLKRTYHPSQPDSSFRTSMITREQVRGFRLPIQANDPCRAWACLVWDGWLWQLGAWGIYRLMVQKSGDFKPPFGCIVHLVNNGNNYLSLNWCSKKQYFVYLWTWLWLYRLSHLCKVRIGLLILRKLVGFIASRYLAWCEIILMEESLQLM